MEITELKREHVPALHRLTMGFGWPHTLQDLEFALQTGRGYAVLDADGLAGTCFTWRFAPDVVSLGLLVVSQDRQGQGYGRALLQRALDDVKGATVLLHATAMAVKLYEQEGFQALGEVRQLQGKVNAASADETKIFSIEDSFSPELAGTFLAADHAACGFDRSQVLKPMFNGATVRMLGNPAAPDAFAVARKFGRGTVIGPVIARSEDEARTLIDDTVRSHAGAFVRIDVTADLTDISWLEDLGFKEVDRVLVMSNGNLPEEPGPQRRFALIGHAFG